MKGEEPAEDDEPLQRAHQWFQWRAGIFYLTSYSERPHRERIRNNPRVGLVVDIKERLRADGERPNRQVRIIIGDAALSVETPGAIRDGLAG